MRRLSAFSGVAALLAVVACREMEAPALTEPPPLTAEQQSSRAEYDARVAFDKAAKSMTPQQVSEADAAWRRNPEDLETLKRLLIYYGPDQAGPVVKDTDANIAARRPLVLWLIEHHPESVLTWHADPRTSKIDQVADPDGYEQARRLWMAHIARPDATATVLDHAATFFESTDTVLAETLVTRAQQLDPEAKTLFANGEPHHWAGRITELYCQALTSNSSGPHAQTIRQRLDASRDAELLARLGFEFSTRCGWRARAAGRGDDLIELGTSYLERAVQLDPQSEQGRSGLLMRAMFDRDRRLDELLNGVPLEKEYEVVSREPEQDRLRYLGWLADRHYARGETDDDSWRTRVRATAEYAWSKRYAQDALALARKFPDDPHSGVVIYQTNLLLGMHALREGDREQAVRYMLDASQTPPSAELARWVGIPIQFRLSHDLLKEGERESVATFYERTASLQPVLRERLLKDAAAVRAGAMPSKYKVSIGLEAPCCG